jgi:hypothetical protein
MQIHLTVPLIVETAFDGKLELLPVVTSVNQSRAGMTELVKHLGQRIPISPTQVEICRRYMRSYESIALSGDGARAFALNGNALVECRAEVFD